MSATTLYRLVWSHLIADEAELVSDSYIFDVGPLTNDQPYFAGFRALAAAARAASWRWATGASRSGSTGSPPHTATPRMRKITRQST